jgi:hypothetical protein
MRLNLKPLEIKVPGTKLNKFPFRRDIAWFFLDLKLIYQDTMCWNRCPQKMFISITDISANEALCGKGFDLCISSQGPFKSA